MSVTLNDDNNNVIDIYSDKIDFYISEFMSENNIDDICKISQNRFSGLLYYLYMKVFKYMGLRKDDNTFDTSKVLSVLEWYLYTCDIYDKVSSMQGFSRLTGVSDAALLTWARDGASPDAIRIAKILQESRERTLSEKLTSGKVNPVGLIACLNHWHGWAGVGNMQEDRERQTATLADVRSMALELSDKSAENPVQS